MRTTKTTTTTREYDAKGKLVKETIREETVTQHDTFYPHWQYQQPYTCTISSTSGTSTPTPGNVTIKNPDGSRIETICMSEVLS